VLGEAVLCAECLRDRVGNQGRVSDRREADPEHPSLELRHDRGRGFDRKARFARAPGSGQGEQAHAVLEKRDNLLDFAVPAHK
jgi:hypothetical protein